MTTVHKMYYTFMKYIIYVKKIVKYDMIHVLRYMYFVYVENIEQKSVIRRKASGLDLIGHSMIFQVFLISVMKNYQKHEKLL